MKNFFASMLGTVVGLMICAAGGAILVIGLFVALAAAGSSKPVVAVEKGAYLVLDLAVNITDAPPQVDGAALIAAAMGEQERKVWQLRQLTRALRAAAKDDRIAGALLLGQFEPDGYGTGYAALKEARAALADFKAAKKPVIAYLEYATIREIYFTSIADELVVDPYGMLLLPGLASEPMYLAGAFEKFGVGVQVTRVGKYKSAIEPFIRRDMSPESREQMQKLLDDVWGDLRGDIASARGLTAEKLQSIVDKEGLILPQSAVSSGFATRLSYRDEVIDDLKARTGRKGSKQSFKQISLVDYAATLGDDKPEMAVVEKKNPAGSREGHVAVIYAEGAIVDGDGKHGEVGGAAFARELRKLRQDEDVKAIVLRVNSPGGSATASEHIQRELRLAKQDKPVVVSMGAYAASGGYWISAYSDRIYAEPTTITGSIGVFGVQFDIEKLAGNLGVTFDRVKTGRFADAVTISRPKTPEELAIVQRMVDWIYDEFVRKVSEARNLPRERVQEIAQGRVWSGAEALKLGLVDELGGMDAAIAFAAEKAGLAPGFTVVEFPKKKGFEELIAEALEGIKPASSRASGMLGKVVEQFESELRVMNQFNDPRGIYARLPLEMMVK
ncbi:signal peptide peptidase SppA [Nibricoccus aquaticus]|uniref:Signal peptide peptidase SppA n=1 Tax=Nibricoccus aquaticus TaxID=2576891 RepID=A0A290QCQ4_9BACT|nr:signal peptide peptidase SppA [Nibricoccus aquaticus]ATC66233.1 signal peptide peptidase SppA [Nibricoccus aquaticus]